MFFWNVFNPKSKLTTLEKLNIQVKIKKIKQNKSNREQNPLEPFSSDAAHNEWEERGPRELVLPEAVQPGYSFLSSLTSWVSQP